MLTVLLGVIALAVFLLAAKGFIAANPTTLARFIRLAGGLAALLVGGVLALTGRGAIGLPLAFIGVSMLVRWGVPGFGPRAERRPGGTSRVRSPMLAMELDLDSGAIRGEVTGGAFAGRDLDSLGNSELAALARELARSDAEGLSLLEAYLDRRSPGWREDLKRDRGAGRRDPPGQSAMSEDEAYQILGLDPGAGADEVRRAHRALMQKLHPDKGGSTWLASRINQAKDVLLRTRG